MNWTPCTAPVTADVIRWTEPIFAPPNKKRGLPDKIGEQRLIAEVVGVGDYLQLAVRSAEKVSLDDESMDVTLTVKPGDSIRRKTSTIEKGDCHKQS